MGVCMINRIFSMELNIKMHLSYNLFLYFTLFYLLEFNQIWESTFARIALINLYSLPLVQANLHAPTVAIEFVTKWWARMVEASNTSNLVEGKCE